MLVGNLSTKFIIFALIINVYFGIQSRNYGKRFFNASPGEKNTAPAKGQTSKIQQHFVTNVAIFENDLKQNRQISAMFMAICAEI